ncbi:hypothetical protein ACJX0J_029251, partial [Zea mays]
QVESYLNTIGGNPNGRGIFFVNFHLINKGDNFKWALVCTGGYAQGGGTEVGDANTQYFHLLANGRHRKTRIFKLQDGNNVIEGDENLMRHITSYYKDLFGPPETSACFQFIRMTKFTASSVLTSIALFMLSFFETSLGSSSVADVF